MGSPTLTNTTRTHLAAASGLLSRRRLSKPLPFLQARGGRTPFHVEEHDCAIVEHNPRLRDARLRVGPSRGLALHERLRTPQTNTLERSSS
jgi:hypothetical protein